VKKRYLFQHLHIAAAAGIFLAVLVLIYLIAARHNERLDFTRGKIHSLAPETVEVLKRLSGSEITIRAFFGEGDPARSDLAVLLKQMATHHPRFHYEFHNPDRSPSQTRKYRIDAYRTVLIEYEKREERIQNAGEETLANALIRLAHPEKQVLCFTTGHGETSLSDTERTGLSDWKRALADYHFETREIQLLAGTGQIPADCDGVIVAGPHYELLPKELDLLQKYPEEGKGLLLLIDPMDSGTGKSFDELARPFGLRLGEDVIVDKISRVFGGDYLTPLITQYAEHPVTEKFRAAAFLPIARTVKRISDVPFGLKVTELAHTHPGSWAETDLQKLEKGEAELDPEKDGMGPVPVAAASEVQEALKGARVVVVGDSDFLTNAHLNVSGNKDLALNILQWLVKDDRWIAIRTQEPRFEPLFLQRNQSVGAAVFAIGGLPFTALLVGSVGIFVRRRRSD